MFKKILLTASLLLLPFMASANDYTGKWQTINDETKKAQSLVTIWEEDGLLKGRIDALLKPDSKGSLCDKCEGDLKDKPIEGMTFIWNMSRDGDRYDDGKILDPASGKVYSANMELIEGGEKLKVRGYIGFSLLGRTQIWEKAE
ncbi:DUF2147 domain-containing protein [Endozoicomonas sp. OPT23]|uniref:DUF2147 domain-containing protein n=1 Tax=Endozoicomonas sp. OPT23 TaxID=2072845 RepID=UPI00129C0CF7|nr:DUF2147 domain-containing protein [Endozoicomonas sp. OPT23]MRI31858.1 DUF2147 domain-containing protein [Endozoicomonas sp. OPT23]